MALEGAGRRKLAELVTNHIFSHIDRDELAAVMHCNGVTDEVRVDRGPAGPGAEDLLIVGLIHDVDLGHEVSVDEGTFFG